MYLRSLLSPQQREEAVGLFERGYGAWFVATRLCVPEGRVARLYDRWRIHGRLCLMNKPTRTQHSYEKKKVVVERVLAGESKPALAQEFQLSSPKLIDAWVRRYRRVRPAFDPSPKAVHVKTMMLRRASSVSSSRSSGRTSGCGRRTRT